jgi:hypothetical protein
LLVFTKTLPLLTTASCLQQVRDEWEIIPSSASGSDVVKLSNGTEVQLFPSSQPHHGHVNETRRKLGDFQQCSPCTCCDRTRSWCIPLVCCYNIQCDLEGLPFGLCSFIPISCTCFGCSSWFKTLSNQQFGVGTCTMKIQDVFMLDVTT